MSTNTKTDKESRDWSTEIYRFEDRVSKMVRDFLSDHGFIGSGDNGNIMSSSAGRGGTVDPRINSFVPRMDIYEGEREYILKADLPGVDKSVIRIEVTDNNLRISGEHKSDEEGTPLLRERIRGNFYRNVNLPSNAKLDDISACHENGVLKVKIGKSDDKKPKSIEIS
ncbi:11486_t:CDS:2 [Acaulospora morrowiae]|uniref:11486_t:CDS:1 n=1 Tax=Acaulospora morrowiae TaxID=94023 RepID=A0A9N9NPL4_9GLOM|nr:11486_t:CDS:2 [Acaulospora morrowiae]